MRILAVTAVLAFFAAAAYAGAEQRLETETLCATIWQPVCAIRGQQSHTFANACSAAAAGWQVTREGSCDGGNGRRISLCLGPDCRQPGAAALAQIR
ncbi:MAG TPA: hypothetical protein GX405_18680 [Rhizobiales bacterium]|nr:hypothetical protein [Hyphomicrobiales bacterium]